MSVRFANEKDIPRMIDLLKQVGEVHHVARPDLFKSGAQKYDEADLNKLLSDETCPIFAFIKDDIMVGYCFCIVQITKGDSVLVDRKVLYIDDLCVDETVRGGGVAKTLFDETVSFAKENGFDAVTLNVWNGNDRAMRFYEKCGLKPYKICMEMKLNG